MTRVEKFFIYWPERHKLGPEEWGALSAKLLTGLASAAHLTGAVGQGAFILNNCKSHMYFIVLIRRFFLFI